MDLLFGGFSKQKLVAQLAAAGHRMTLHHQRKKNDINKQREQVAGFLKARKFDQARIYVEAAARDQRKMEAEELLSLMLDLLKQKVDYLASERTCPEEALESVHTLIWSARFTDVSEFRDIAGQFKYKYGEDFFRVALNDVAPHSRVNAKIKARLSMAKVPDDVVRDSLVEIATAKGIPFDPVKDLASSEIGLGSIAGSDGKVAPADASAAAGAATGAPGPQGGAAEGAGAAATPAGQPGQPQTGGPGAAPGMLFYDPYTNMAYNSASGPPGYLPAHVPFQMALGPGQFAPGPHGPPVPMGAMPGPAGGSEGAPGSAPMYTAPVGGSVPMGQPVGVGVPGLPGMPGSVPVAMPVGYGMPQGMPMNMPMGMPMMPGQVPYGYMPMGSPMGSPPVAQPYPYGAPAAYGPAAVTVTIGAHPGQGAVGGPGMAGAAGPYPPPQQPGGYVYGGGMLAGGGSAAGGAASAPGAGNDEIYRNFTAASDHQAEMDALGGGPPAKPGQARPAGTGQAATSSAASAGGSGTGADGAAGGSHGSKLSADQYQDELSRTTAAMAAMGIAAVPTAGGGTVIDVQGGGVGASGLEGAGAAGGAARAGGGRTSFVPQSAGAVDSDLAAAAVASAGAAGGDPQGEDPQPAAVVPTSAAAPAPAPATNDFAARLAALRAPK